jgi:hypothetical protein
MVIVTASPLAAGITAGSLSRLKLGTVPANTSALIEFTPKKFIFTQQL